MAGAPVALSGWFVAVLAVGAVPVIAIAQWWVLPTWVLGCLALAGIDLALAASPRAMRVARDVPARLRLGERAAATLRIENVGGRRLRGVVRDAWPPSARATPSRQRVTVPPGETRSLQTRLDPFRRGLRQGAGVTIRSFGPLRLAARQATLRAPAAVLVLPPFQARRHLPSRLARLRELDGSSSVMLRGHGTEFDSLRDYVRGDDVRSIDWRASARRTAGTGGAQLVVRTWRPERDRRVVIVIDSGRAAAARVGDETRLDVAFEAALLLGALAAAAGDRVDLLVHDRRLRARVQAAAGSALLPGMVEAMASVEPELLESDWSALPGLIDAATSQRALVVLATTPESPAAARALLGVLPQLTHRHLVLVAAVDDPEVIAAAAKRDGLSDVHLAAAAERAGTDRAAVEAAVRHLGGDWLSATPAELPPALADRYLAVKAAGRL